MLVLLDNYDSFTYNLYQYLSELGAAVEVFRNDQVTVDQVRDFHPDAIVLSPGPGRPENAGIMPELIRAVAERTPVLGICLGHQAIGQAFGASIGYAPSLMHGKTSEVTHDGSALFRGVPSPFVATRYHSLVITPGTLPEEFKVTAQSADGVIMGLQHRTLPLFGLQFHPESFMTPDGKTILGNFLEALP